MAPRGLSDVAKIEAANFAAADMSVAGAVSLGFRRWLCRSEEQLHPIQRRHFSHGVLTRSRPDISPHHHPNLPLLSVRFASHVGIESTSLFNIWEKLSYTISLTFLKVYAILTATSVSGFNNKFISNAQLVCFSDLDLYIC